MDADWDRDQAKIQFDLKELLVNRVNPLANLLALIRIIEREGSSTNIELSYQIHRDIVREIEDKLNDRIDELIDFDIYHPIVSI